MLENRAADPDELAHWELETDGCARAVLHAYAVSMRYAQNKEAAFHVAIRTWRRQYKQASQDEAENAVAAILSQEYRRNEPQR